MEIAITSNNHSNTVWEDMRHWLLSADIDSFHGQVIYDHLEDICKMLDIDISEFRDSSIVFQKDGNEVEIDTTVLLDWINSCIDESDYDEAVLHESLETMMFQITE